MASALSTASARGFTLSNPHRVSMSPSRSGGSSSRTTPARTGRLVAARAQDKLCKDMVNEKKDVSGLDGTAKVTFLGANGQEFTLDCPLVRCLPPSHCDWRLFGGTCLRLQHGRTANTHAWASTEFLRPLPNAFGISRFLFSLMHPQGTYMLDAGIKEGLELPYSCRGGICGYEAHCHAPIGVSRHHDPPHQ